MNEGSSEDSWNADYVLIDYSGISLDQLAQLDDSTLVHSLNRIIGDVEKPDEVVLAGFNASI